MRNTFCSLVLLLSLGPLASGAARAECEPPKIVVTTSAGMKFFADPAFDGAIASCLQTIRQDIQSQRQAGKLVIYASTPISPRGGGHMEINLEIAASVKTRLERAGSEQRGGHRSTRTVEAARRLTAAQL
jgi:hypothetical protein